LLEQRLGVGFKWEDLPLSLQERIQAGLDDRDLLEALQVLTEDVKEEIWASESAVMMASALILCFAFAGAYIFLSGPLRDNYWFLLGMYTFNMIAVLGGFFYAYQKRVANMIRLKRIMKAQERLLREVAEESKILLRASGRK